MIAKKNSGPKLKTCPKKKPHFVFQARELNFPERLNRARAKLKCKKPGLFEKTEIVFKACHILDSHIKLAMAGSEPLVFALKHPREELYRHLEETSKCEDGVLSRTIALSPGPYAIKFFRSE